jgi:hypothetical protein
LGRDKLFVSELVGQELSILGDQVKRHKLVALPANCSRDLLRALSGENANVRPVPTLHGQAVQLPIQFPGLAGFVMDDETFGLCPYLLMEGGPIRRGINALGPGVAKGVE